MWPYLSWVRKLFTLCIDLLLVEVLAPAFAITALRAFLQELDAEFVHGVQSGFCSGIRDLVYEYDG